MKIVGRNQKYDIGLRLGYNIPLIKLEKFNSLIGRRAYSDNKNLGANATLVRIT
jgi:hypothetical protein